MEPVFNGTKHMILLISKDGLSLEVYLQVPQLALLEDGLWVEAIAPLPLNLASVDCFITFILPMLYLIHDTTIQVLITLFNSLLSSPMDL